MTVGWSASHNGHVASSLRAEMMLRLAPVSASAGRAFRQHRNQSLPSAVLMMT